MTPSATRDTIASAFWTLCRQKDVDRITVSDISAACSITRQAFYYHFQSLNATVQYAVERYAQTLADRIIGLHGDYSAAIALAFTPAVEAPDVILRLSRSKKYPFHRLATDAIMTQTARLFLDRQITRDLGFDATEMTVRFYAGGFFANLLGASQAKLQGQRVDTLWMAHQYLHLLRGDLLPKTLPR